MAFPISRTHCGLALGNAAFGVLVWGDERLNLTLGHRDFRDRRGGLQWPEGVTYADMVKAYDVQDRSKLDGAASLKRPKHLEYFNPRRLPVGRFELSLRDGAKLSKATLDLCRGRLKIAVETKDGGKETLELVAGIRDDMALILDKGNLIEAVHCRPSWEWVGETLAACQYLPPEPLATDRLSGWTQTCPEDPAITVFVGKVKPGVLGVFSGLGADGAAARAEAERAMAKFEATGVRRFLAESDAWWKKYWEGVPEISIPSKYFMTFSDYALYKFGCATNPDRGGGASGLQGPWTEEYQFPPWSCAYTLNVNIQQIYAAGFPSGRFDHVRTLFDMLESEKFMNSMKRNARLLFGIEDGLLIFQNVDDQCNYCFNISPAGVLDFAITGWLAQLYWLYYRYTGDEKFLRERAWPFMFGAVRCFEEALERQSDGTLAIPIGISAEYGITFDNGKAQNVGRNPSWILANARALATVMIEAAKILGKPPHPAWREILEKLPPYALVGEKGEERIGIWEGQDLDVCHRHHSHLSSIYPFDTLGEMSSDARKILDNSIDHWIEKGMGEWSEWCFPWASIIHSRLGFRETAFALLDIWRKVFVNEGLATVYFPARTRGITVHPKGRRKGLAEKPVGELEIMQLDGTMAGLTALYELLVHEKAGTVYVFPAVPEEWRDAAFENIRVPGAFEIGAERKNGATRQVEIHSRKGGTLRLVVTDATRMTLTRDGKTETASFPLTLTLKAGERVVLRAPEF